MYAVFRKELLQIRHHTHLRVYFAMLVLADAALVLCEIRYPGGFPWLRAAFRAALFFGIFTLVALFSIRWARERNDISIDPVLTTRLAPHRILAGKFAALFLIAAALSLAGSAIDFRTAATSAYWENLLLETGRWGVLTAFVLAFGAFRKKNPAHAALSGAAALLLALILLVAAAGRDVFALLLPRFAEAGAFDRLFPAEIWLTAFGLLVADAGLAKKSSDRMAKLHGFFIVSALASPLWLWKTTGAFSAGTFRACFAAAALIFLYASLVERRRRTPLQRNVPAFPFLATGSFPAWCWSAVFTAAAFFTAPAPAARLADLSNWTLSGFYIALARIFSRRHTVVAFGIVVLLCNLPALFAERLPFLAALSADGTSVHDSYFRAGILFAASIILRIPEFAAFFRREKI
ncbi:MAG: hypothetical protein MJ016_00270 [Victivallaceae bacterium]|nr:hypothetical protein [Victivallaceae bacterium]